MLVGADVADLSQFKGHPVLLETFQGPLDLLLHLIKKDRIEIWQVSISRITRQYLEYLSTLRALNIEVAGEFLVMAATLMRIKSQNLLPRPSFLPEEEDEVEPLTREGLIQRLVEYRKFKEAARTMTRMEWAQSRMHSRGAPALLAPGHSFPLREPKLLDLAEYLRELLGRQDAVTTHDVHLEEIRLEDQIEWVTQCVRNPNLHQPLPGGEGWGLPFESLLRRPWMRLELVVTLLASLELARLQILRLYQRQALETIWLLKRETLAGAVPEERP